MFVSGTFTNSQINYQALVKEACTIYTCIKKTTMYFEDTKNDNTSTWQTYLKLSIFYNKNIKVDNLMDVRLTKHPGWLCVTSFAPVSHRKIHSEEEGNKFGKYILENEPPINLLAYNYQNASPSEVEGIVRKEISPLDSRQIKPVTILSWGNQQLVMNVASLPKEDTFWQKILKLLKRVTSL